MLDELKKSVSKFALSYIPKNAIVGIGSGSTVKIFINELSAISNFIKGAVPSSVVSEKLLRKNNIPILDLNKINFLDIYIDSADQVNHSLEMIKGGGGALTKEKIIASNSKKFLCIVDYLKYVECFNNCPLPIEVIPLALNFVSKEVIKLGGKPKYRKNFVTDNGNYIIDIFDFYIKNSLYLENFINNIPGVVSVGLFCFRKADILLISYPNNKIKKISF